ncbi:beta-ketoacyl reductase, partial [Amycolatopsis sp. NPDC000740]|uniref:beta-ketoacyl reductase n=1 Tax=Amycolatopsis sp. NPDC000740 TaxID=3154269 RepID=UPI00332AFD3C
LGVPAGKACVDLRHLHAYLDALARRRRAAGRTATAVAWGSWGGGGMVDADASDLLRRMGLAEMDPRLAVEALGQALDHDESQLVVADIDWAAFAPVYQLARPRPLLRGIPEAAADQTDAEPVGAGDLATRLASLSPAEQRRTVLDLVRGEVAAVAGYDDGGAVEPARAFKELGFDSVTAVAGAPTTVARPQCQPPRAQRPARRAAPRTVRIPAVPRRQRALRHQDRAGSPATATQASSPKRPQTERMTSENPLSQGKVAKDADSGRVSLGVVRARLAFRRRGRSGRVGGHESQMASPFVCPFGVDLGLPLRQPPPCP